MVGNVGMLRDILMKQYDIQYFPPYKNLHVSSLDRTGTSPYSLLNTMFMFMLIIGINLARIDLARINFSENKFQRG